MFVDRDSQCTGRYAQYEPLAALAQRWMRDARKLSATERLADLERDERPALTGDAARQAGMLPRSGWELLSRPPQGVRTGLKNASVHLSPRSPEEAAARMPALIHELAAPGKLTGRLELADGWEFGDGLGRELDFE